MAKKKSTNSFITFQIIMIGKGRITILLPINVVIKSSQATAAKGNNKKFITRNTIKNTLNPWGLLKMLNKKSVRIKPAKTYDLNKYAGSRPANIFLINTKILFNKNTSFHNFLSVIK